MVHSFDSGDMGNLRGIHILIVREIQKQQPQLSGLLTVVSTKDAIFRTCFHEFRPHIRTIMALSWDTSGRWACSMQMCRAYYSPSRNP